MMVSFLRSKLRTLHHAAVQLWYGNFERTRTMNVGDVEATFKVSNWKEYWRVENVMGEREFFAHFLRECEGGKVVWDVGAAVGNYSIMAAAAGCRSIAFEPIPENAKRCWENAQLNGLGDQVTVLPSALSNKNRQMDIRPSKRMVGEGTHHFADDPEKSLSIQAFRGDSIDYPDPDIIKIDVEGHELEVIDGLGELINEVSAVFVEVHEEDYNIPPEFVEGELEQAGLEVTELESNRRQTYLKGIRKEENQ